MSNEYKIAVLTPTRGRTTQLEKAVKSIIEQADNPNSIQIMLGFDNDDTIGLTFFEDHLQPWLDDHNVNYQAIGFERMGYQGLNRYYNELASHTDSDWILSWSDDSYIDTQGWDTEITQHTGKFKLLKVHTHNEHPYSIFPIWPREWYNLFGHCSRHQMIDAELSQMAYMLDLIEIIDVNVTHDRPDLTDAEPDATNKERVLFEGNPRNPYDFHNPAVAQQRLNDTELIAQYLISKGHDMSFWNNVKAGTQDPWQKMRENDPNGQTSQFHIPN
jgi:hypothetical protein